MKKSTKITLWVVGSFLAVVIVGFLSADIIASHIVKREVRKALENMPGAEAQVGGIYLNFLTTSAVVKDITFSTNSLTLEDTITGLRAPGLAVHIPTLAVWNINYQALMRDQELKINKITLDDPQLLIYLDEKDPASILPTLPKDTTLEKAGTWLQQVGLKKLEINRFSARLKGINSPLYLSVDSLSVFLHQELNSFIRPLVGITSECHIDRLDAVYHGDRHLATGTFCMQYHGLSVHVHKEDKIPYEIVTKYADTFNQLANTLIPKSNPTAVDIVPRKYDVFWKRDEWKPYPLYLFGPCIDGVKMTMLPGLYVHKQSKQ